MGGAEAERVQQQVRAWRDELIDLSRRNRLLNYKPTKSSSLVIARPDTASILRGLGGPTPWRFHYPELTEDEERDVALVRALHTEDSELDATLRPDELLAEGRTARELSRVLHTLHRKALSEYNDKGLRVLYLGVGTVVWRDGDGQRLRSPLLLVPVALDRPSPREPFRLLGTDDDAVINPALQVKFDQDFGIELDLAAETDAIETLYAEARGAISDQRGWELVDEVVLSVFSFHKEAMYQDLKENEQETCDHPLISTLSVGASSGHDMGFDPIPEDQLDSRREPEHSAAILDADATQRQCIAAALDGRTFVVHGPPGTGKSQTIANVIAELLGQQKTVLFVSEKAAALDVVQRRLEAAGLGHYVLELHSHKATRKEVAQTLGRSLDNRPRPARILTDDELADARRRREALSAYAVALNEVHNPLGLSLHTLLGRRMRLEDHPAAPIPDHVTSELPREDLASIQAAAREWSMAWGPVARGDDFLWRDLVDTAGTLRRLAAVQGELGDVLTALVESEDRALELAVALDEEAPSTVDDVSRIGRIADLLSAAPQVPPGWVTDELGPLDERRRTVAQGWDLLSTHLADLREVAGAAAADLDPEIASQIDRTVDELGQGLPPLDLEPTIDSEGIASLAEALHDRAALGEQIHRDAIAVAGALGVPPGDLTSTRARILGQAALLADEVNRPETAWLRPDGLAAARQAAQVLNPILTRYRELVAQIFAVFEPQVAQLDVEAFYDGPTDLAPKLSRLTARGRGNRKQLLACVKGGKVTKEAVACLPSVRQWKATWADLSLHEPTIASPLGSHYYQSTETDLGALDQALSVAEQALTLLDQLGQEGGLEGTIDRSGRGGEDLAAQGRALIALLDRWDAPPVHPSATATAPLTVDRAADWAEKRARTLDDLGPSVLAVDAVAGAGDLGRTRHIATLRHQAHAEEQELLSDREGDDRLLGRLYLGPDTDWDAWQSARDWTETLRSELHGAINEGRARAILAKRPEEGWITEHVVAYAKGCATVLASFRPDYAASLAEDLGLTLADARDLLTALRDQTGEIDEWAAFDAARSRLVDAGLSEVVTFCESHRPSAEQVVGVVERAVYSAVADDILASDDRCRPLRSGDRDALVAEFRQIDRDLVAHGAAKVIEACNAGRPTQIVGEAATIRREGEKKTRHMPVKKILGDAGRVVQSLRPCFMMSPLTVSQFLPGDMPFDAVIFDEASQVRPSDAANAIRHGAQLIVAGDEKQLPPTSFFDRANADGDDEYAEEDLDVFESLLDICKGSGGVPSLPLRWHYRSQHESLITYSNRSFYGGSLVTYPGALETGEDIGLELFHVPDAVYRRGEGRDNPVEARKVVERVLFHATHHPDTTLGVVAFSEAQATRIVYELDMARVERPDLDDFFQEDRLDGVFVKNLESVQGDERDIIIFSIGYGRDENGKLTMQFGPLNKEGGQRRLNVAITRARRRVEVVSSITAADFADQTSAGVTHLRRYLDFAQRGLPALSVEEIDPEAQPESPFEEEVLSVIADLGHIATPQVGQAGYRIDIGVRHPEQTGRFVLGVECDGAAYHSSRAARDRDRLRQEVLEGLGWRLYRIWGPAWYRDRPGETERLRTAIEAAVRGDEPPQPVRDAAPAPMEVELEEVDFDAMPGWATPFVPADLGYRHYGKEIDSPSYAADLRSSLREVVDGEGPVSVDVCMLRIREGWGIGRASARIRKIVDGAIDAAVARDQLFRTDDGFLYASPDQLEVVRCAEDGDPDTIRKAAQVCRGELALALTRLLAEAGTADREELMFRTARLFGWGRRGNDITAALNSALRQLIEDGNVIEGPDGRLEPTDVGR